MGCAKETGIFCLIPDRKIPVGYCFDCCCFFFCTSPPGYEMGDDKSEEAANRRRGLLKIVCSQERAVSLRTNEPWSELTSVWFSILLNWMPLPCLPSTSACYWDPRFAFPNYSLCSYLVQEYTAFSASGECPSCLEVYHNLLYDLPLKIIVGCDCPCDDLVKVKTPPMSVMTLSYIAQVLVVTIVGLNMGFRWFVGVSYMRGTGGKVATGSKTENNSTVGKTPFKFGRNFSCWRRKAPLRQFMVVPSLCHMPTVPKRTKNKKRILNPLNPVCYNSEHANETVPFLQMYSFHLF